MEKGKNTNGEKFSKSKSLMVGFLLSLNVLLPNTGAAKEKYSSELLDNLSTEQIQNPKTISNIGGSPAESSLNLSYNVLIPPKLNSLYKKLASIDKAEKIADLEFTQWEIWFLETGQFMNADWITKSAGKKASKSVISNFSKLTEDDIDKFYKDYLSKNPYSKLSKHKFEVLSQPITAQQFFIKWEIANREQNLWEVFHKNWHSVQLPHQTLFVLKFKSEGKKWVKVYESRNVYKKFGKNKLVSEPIKIAVNSEWKFSVQDAKWAPLLWRCAIGVDGHLYQIDDLGNAIWKDGSEHPIKRDSQWWYIFDKQKFIAIWDYSILGQKQDITDGRNYILFNIQPTPEKMLLEKYENKKNSLLLLYKRTNYPKQGYTLLENQETKTLFLEKEWFVSGHAPDVMSLDAKELETWLWSAKQEIDKNIDERDLYIAQAAQKDQAFQAFLNAFCVTTTESTGQIVSILDVDNNRILIDFGMKGSYYIIKKDIPTDTEPQEILLIDLQTWEELYTTRNEKIYITDGSGNSLDEKRVFRSIVVTIKKYENKKSYDDFIEKISLFINTPMEELKKYWKWFEYRWFVVYPWFDYTWRSDWKYNIEIFEWSRQGRWVYIPVTVDMSGLDIKRAIDKAIDAELKIQQLK